MSPTTVGASQRRWAPSDTRNELGPITETEASSGVFELEFTLGHDNSYSQTSGTVIKQGDILTVEYTDPTDASGDSTYLATDSATTFTQF